MTEKSYYAKIIKHYLPNPTKSKQSLAIEVKITKTNVLNFKCLPSHQEEALLESERSFGHKIADAGRGKKPFDIFVLRYAISYMIVIYYKPRATEIFEIPLREFIHEKYKKWDKSLSIQRAREIGKVIHI